MKIRPFQLFLFLDSFQDKEGVSLRSGAQACTQGPYWRRAVSLCDSSMHC